MSPSTISKISFILAALDLWIAAVCAASGDIHFVAFMVLSGLMYAHRLYFKSKTEEEKGE